MGGKHKNENETQHRPRCSARTLRSLSYTSRDNEEDLWIKTGAVVLETVAIDSRTYDAM